MSISLVFSICCFSLMGLTPFTSDAHIREKLKIVLYFCNCWAVVRGRLGMENRLHQKVVLQTLLSNSKERNKILTVKSIFYFFWIRKNLLKLKLSQDTKRRWKKNNKDTAYRRNIYPTLTNPPQPKQLRRKSPYGIKDNHTTWRKLWLWNLIINTKIQSHIYASANPKQPKEKVPKQTATSEARTTTTSLHSRQKTAPAAAVLSWQQHQNGRRTTPQPKHT